MGAAILTYTAATLLLEDPLVRHLYPHTAAFAWAGTLLALAGVLGLAHWRNRRHTPALPARRHDTVPRGTRHARTTAP